MHTPLVKNGQSDYTVIYPQNASPSVLLAAREFVNLAEEVTGAVLPMKADSESVTSPEVLIGYTNRNSQAYGKVAKAQQGNDGFMIRSGEGELVLAGGDQRGTLYAVYTFFEDYVGCRWFTPKITRIPKKSSILVPEISRIEKPALEYREPYFYEVFSAGQEWSVKNKCNGTSAKIDNEHGGAVRYGAFVHTFNSIIPPAQYGESHPEYFSMVDGVRKVDHSQLCLTNPEVLEIAIKKVRQWIKDSPESMIFSVSQNDWGNYCTCPSCAAIDAEEESHAGSLLRFVNAIAADIADDYPEVAIDTLAYQYTRKAPKLTKPLPNVIIRLCSIECCEVHPYRSCHVSKDNLPSPSGQPFAQDLADWSDICDRLYIWDYSANFHLYLFPHPTLHAFADNMQFFVENSVKGVFHEGCDGDGGGGYCAELKAYITAKLMWDPYCDVQRHRSEFLIAYYGLAAYKMHQIFDQFLTSALEGGAHLFFAMAANQVFVKQDDILIPRCRRLFDEAELMAESDEILDRIKRARIWLRLLEITSMPVGEVGRAELIDNLEADCLAYGYRNMGCAPIMSVKELFDLLREKSDTHP